MSVELVESVEQAREAYRRFRESDGFLSFDTETTGLYVRTPYGDHGRTVQFSWRPWAEAVVFEMTPQWEDAIAAFFDTASGLVAHNMKFDTHVMATYGIEINYLFHPRDLHDTVWVARLHDERDRAQLKPLASKYIHIDAASEQGKLKRLMKKRGWGWDTVPVRYLVEYGGTDAIITGQLYDKLFPRIGYALDAYQTEQDLSPVIYQMERAGLPVDQKLFWETLEMVRAEVLQAEKNIEDLAPTLNPRAPHKLKAALRERGIEVKNTQAATLEALEGSDSLVDAVLRYRKSHKVLTTYLEPWVALITPEGRIHPNLNQLGASTGRFSSSDPNFQNIKRGHTLRDIFRAPEGWKMVVADYDQMELRVYAHYADDQRMIQVFLSGEDLYQSVADELGVTRQVGKMVVLASIYGVGHKSLKAQVEAAIPEMRGRWSLSTYKDMHARFHRLYRIRDLAEKTELAARRRGFSGDPYIKTWGGRRQRPKRILRKPVNGHRQTVYIYKDLGNSLVQGSSADIVKRAIIDAADAGLGPYMRLTVHDEIVAEVPDDRVRWAESILEDVMTRHDFIPPLTVSASSAQTYGEAK